jgi:hypothetical protein
MSASSTKADQNHSGKTYRNIFAYVSFVLRLACTAIDLEDQRDLPRGQYANKTLHSRCQTALPIWFSPDGNLDEVKPANPVFITVLARGNGWWRQTGSNRRPEACKATALPTELCPQLDVQPIMVGLGGLEPPTSRLSSARSNQLSYRP